MIVERRDMTKHVRQVALRDRANRENRNGGGNVLMVTRPPPGPVFHLGHVDARANPYANELAREIADRHARGSDCGEDAPAILGEVGPGAAFK
jgi:hypothetical protein